MYWPTSTSKSKNKILFYFTLINFTTQRNRIQLDTENGIQFLCALLKIKKIKINFTSYSSFLFDKKDLKERDFGLLLLLHMQALFQKELAIVKRK